MNQQDLMDTVDVAAPRTGRRWRPALAVLGTAVVTAASLPVHLFLAFMFAVGSQRYDTSGSGGPLKNCDSELYCSDPNYLWMLGTGVFMVILWLLAAQVGQLIWGPGPRGVRLLTLMLLSAALTAAGCAIAYYLMTHATHAIY